MPDPARSFILSVKSDHRMQASSKADKSCRQSLLDDRNEPTQHHTQRWLTAVSLLLCALLVTIVLLGGSYQQNALLQQRLSGKLTLDGQIERNAARAPLTIEMAVSQRL